MDFSRQQDESLDVIVDGSSGSHSVLKEIKKFLELKGLKNIQYSEMLAVLA